MDSFTFESVSNDSSQFFPNNTLSSLKNFLPEQVNLDGQWDVVISETSYPSMYQNIREGKYMFCDDKFSKTAEAYYLEPGPSITDIVEAKTTFTQEKNSHRDTCIRNKVIRVTQKMEVFLAEEETILAISSTDLGHIFGGGVRNDLGICMRGKRLHEPTFTYDTVRLHSLMIYTGLIE